MLISSSYSPGEGYRMESLFDRFKKAILNPTFKVDNTDNSINKDSPKTMENESKIRETIFQFHDTVNDTILKFHNENLITQPKPRCVLKLVCLYLIWL